MARNYKKYQIYKDTQNLIVKIYSLTKNFPKEEMYGLSSQLRRAVTSILLNLCEGASRDSNKEFKNFLNISYGSCKEVEEILIICEKLLYLNNDKLNDYLIMCDNISKQLYNLKLKVEVES